MASRLVKEFCAENVERVPEAIAAGAGRIELCDNLAVGGTTPSHGVILAAVELARPAGIPVMCMIRPRGGSFECSGAEARIMVDDLRHAAELGVDGVVFGCLRDGEVDRELTGRLAGLAKEAGLMVTFHMAFDEISADAQPAALNLLAGLGVDRVLTHGGAAGTPIAGNLERLRRLVDYAAGRLEILPGGGVTWENAEEVADAVGVREVHGTRIVKL